MKSKLIFIWQNATNMEVNIVLLFCKSGYNRFVKQLPSQFLLPVEPECEPMRPSELGPLGSLSFYFHTSSLRTQCNKYMIPQSLPAIKTAEYAQKINLNKACQIFALV